MINYSSVMIDIETAALIPNAVILSISAVAFNPFEISTDFSNNPKLDMLIDIDSQPNRIIDSNTINWWKKQSDATINKVFNEKGRISIKEALNKLIKFTWLKQRIWVQGVSLDIPVLENAYYEQKLSIPWSYAIIRDSRTLLDLVSVTQPTVQHDSLDDCYRQIQGVQQALKKLNITKFVRI
jgi:hypothetical protein